MHPSGDLPAHNAETPSPPGVRKTTPLDPTEIIKRLKELREAKLLTEEEYQARISRLMDETA